MKNAKKKFIISLFAISLLTMTIGFFAQADSGWTVSGGTVIKSFTGYSSGTVLINISGIENISNCSSSMVAFTTANADTDKILKMVLTAQASGKEIKCWVSGCIDPSDVGGSTTYQTGYQCTLIH